MTAHEDSSAPALAEREGWTRGLARVGSVAFALLLWTSAFLKAVGPNFTASTLSWTGWSFEVRVHVVDATVIAEALVAAALLGCGRNRAVQAVGALTAVLLLVLHLLVVTRGDGGCGCFGEVVVPDAVTFAGLAVGLVSCGWLALRGSLPKPSSRRKRGTGLLVVVCVLVAAVWPLGGRDPMAPIDRMLTRVAMEPGTREALFVIGAFACAPCYEEIERIDALRTTHPGLPAVPVYFVSPVTSDPPEDIGTRFPWLRNARVPEELWRRLTDSGSPAFIHYRIGEEREVETDWRIGTVEQMSGGR